VDDTTFWISYAVLGVLFTALELLRPARRLRYRKALLVDAIGFAVYQFAVFPLALAICTPLAGHVLLPPALLDIWLPVRVVAYYLIADCGSYWLHRLMHTRHIWRIHRWHHSPTQMYWLAGVRASLPQQILFNLPYLAAVPLLTGIPPWGIVAVTLEGVVRNNWMHMNVAWRSNWIERVFVTPRYHHIHHSADADQHDGNYGSLFSIWDRLFGTYLDPDTTAPKTFGTGEKKKRDPILLMLGL
jgi:sterol desaturase/sphingolipid hydroxylase (fatty acid hydroxylase superfamily)